LLYAGLTWSVINVLVTSHASGGNQQKQAAGVFGWPGGRWIVLAAGVVVLAYAGWNVYSGVTRKFEEQLERTPDWVKPLGVVGLCARGVVFAVVGWFLVKAALDFNPQKAVGIGGALAKLAQAPLRRRRPRRHGGGPPRLRRVLPRANALPRRLTRDMSPECRTSSNLDPRLRPKRSIRGPDPGDD
jgi:hypothetical protein